MFNSAISFLTRICFCMFAEMMGGGNGWMAVTNFSFLHAVGIAVLPQCDCILYAVYIFDFLILLYFR